MHVILDRTLKLSSAAVLLICLAIFPGVGAESTPTSSPSPLEAENRSIAFYPEESGPGTFISVEIKPGSSANFSVVVGNSGSVPQQITTYSVPATSAANGGFSMEEMGTELDEQTKWITYPETELDLGPGEGVVIDGKISVPESTRPGEYITALAAQQSEPFAVEGSDTFNQIIRWSVPIQILVPGDMTASFSIGWATLEQRDNMVVAEIGIANAGSMTVRPEGKISLIDGEGNVVGTSKVDLESVYAGTSTVFYAAWENVPVSDSYSLSYSLSDERIGQPVIGEIGDLTIAGMMASEVPDLLISSAELVPLTKDNPPSTLQFNGVIANNGEPIENARVSIVTYQDGVEVDRYPIMQAVTIQQGETPVEARYSLPGGFTDGTYTFEVTIELGDAGTQTVLLTQAIEFEVVVP